MRRVLITEKIHPDAEALLRQHFKVVQGSGTEHVAEELQGCEGSALHMSQPRIWRKTPS